MGSTSELNRRQDPASELRSPHSEAANVARTQFFLSLHLKACHATLFMPFMRYSMCFSILRPFFEILQGRNMMFTHFEAKAWVAIWALLLK